MNISKTKIAFYLLTFQKSKIPQYLLDVGNNWVVNSVSSGTQDSIKTGLATGKTVLNALTNYAWLCPEKWRSAYQATVAAFAEVVASCEDLKLTVDEIAAVTLAFKAAYSEWCAD